jgi:hypothetical protein
MKIVCASDLHGFLPEIPDCDLLLLGGDYCPTQRGQNFWVNQVFAPWITEQSKTKKIIGVAGNHDEIFQKYPDSLVKMDWVYLQDSGYEWGGFKFWGSPWQPRFHDWAFNADEWELEKYWEQIPEDTDILLLHGPPFSYGDFSPFGCVNTGSPSLLKKIEEIQPKLVIAGHIHSGYGVYKIGQTTFLSCSLVDEAYRLKNPPHIIEL